MYDAIVVGAGPSGSYTARRLAEKGHRVLVLEAKPQITGKSSCTGIVGWECINTFGIDEKVILRQANSAIVYSPSGRTLHLQRNEPQACILDRKVFDNYLAERAQKAGAEYKFNCRVTDIIKDKDHAEVQTRQGNKAINITAKVIIIACGFNPGLVRQAGLGEFKDYAAGAQAEVEIAGLKEVEVYFGEAAPGFFAWLAPTAPGKAKAGLLVRRDPRDLLTNWLKRLKQEGKIISNDVKIDFGGIPLRPPAYSYSDRLVAVGDAAGQTKPTSGGGIYYGLIGAETAAVVLHQALAEGDLSATRLARYEKAWRKKLGREMRTGYWARRLYEKLSNEQVDMIFKIMKSSGIDEALLKAKDLSFDWHSRTIIRLLKYQAVAGTLKIIRLPFRAERIDH